MFDVLNPHSSPLTDPTALESVQEIFLLHLPLGEVILNELLTTFEEIPEEIMVSYEDLLTVVVRSVSPR